MKKILLLAMLLTSFSFAENLEKSDLGIKDEIKCGTDCPMVKENKMTFEQRKRKALNKLDEHKTCVTNATTKEELKDCRPKHKEGKKHKDRKEESKN